MFNNEYLFFIYEKLTLINISVLLYLSIKNVKINNKMKNIFFSTEYLLILIMMIMIGFVDTYHQCYHTS